jgi:hypothetical protein
MGSIPFDSFDFLTPMRDIMHVLVKDRIVGRKVRINPHFFMIPYILQTFLLHLFIIFLLIYLFVILYLLHRRISLPFFIYYTLLPTSIYLHL